MQPVNRRPRLGDPHRICGLDKAGIGHHPYPFGPLRSALLGTLVKGGKSCDCASFLLFCFCLVLVFSFLHSPSGRILWERRRLLKGKFPGSSGYPRFLHYHGWKEAFGKSSKRLMRSFIHSSEPNIVKNPIQSPLMEKKIRKIIGSVKILAKEAAGMGGRDRGGKPYDRFHHHLSVRWTALF